MILAAIIFLRFCVDRHFRFSDEGIFTTDVWLWIYIRCMDHLDTTIGVRE
jgi:hypothetical protein